MLFTHWSAASASPQQHELASSADRVTLVRDQSVPALLDGRLRGVIISGLGNSGTFTCTVPLNMQMYWITESPLFSSCLSVVLGHLGLWHSRLSHSVHEVGDVLDPTSLVLIASPVLCSPTIKGSTVVAVRVVVRLGSGVHRRSSQLGSATMAGWSAPLLLTSRVGRLCVTCACAWSWLSHPRPPDRSQHGCTVGVDLDPPVASERQLVPCWSVCGGASYKVLCCLCGKSRHCVCWVSSHNLYFAFSFSSFFFLFSFLSFPFDFSFLGCSKSDFCWPQLLYDSLVKFC